MKNILYQICFLLLIYAASGNCQSESSEEKRSTILESDGYAFLAEDKTISELRDLALLNAKRNALADAQTFIKSIVTTDNYKLISDIIASGAEGSVTILEKIDNGITSDNRYHIWIKAEVTYSLNQPDFEIPGVKSKTLPDASSPLTVNIRTEYEKYKSGDKVKIFIEGNKQYYAKIVYIDSKGDILQLLPNRNRKDNCFDGRKTFQIPDANDNFELEVSPPFGKEKVIVYASTEPLGEGDIEKFGNINLVKSGLDEYGMKTRGIKIKNKPAEFYEASCILTTEP